MMKRVYIASDHAGFALKEALIPHIKNLGYAIEDMGAFTYDESDDYPDYVTPCAKRVVNEAGNALGIVIGGSGQGEAMAANRVPGIRSAVFYGPRPSIGKEGEENDGFDIVRVARLHNDANVLSIGVRFVTDAEVQGAVRAFLETEFSGEERHLRRIAKF